MKNRNIFTYVTSILVCFIVVYIFLFDKKLFLGGDNAFYYILGKSINEGFGYRNIHMYGNPLANHFPPGYPLLISFAMWISQSVLWIKAFNGFFMCGSLLLMFFIVRKITSNNLFACLSSLVVLFNGQIIRYSYVMMSEIPFLFFSLLTLYFVLKSDLRINRYFIFSILSLIFTFYIRSQGVALLGGITLFYLFRKKWKMIGITIGSFVLGILPWSIRGMNLGGNGYLNQIILKNPYRPELGVIELYGWIERIIKNGLRYISKEIPRSVLPSMNISQTAPSVWYHYVIGMVLILVFIYGIYTMNKKYQGLIIGYLGGQFGIQLLWPDVWFGIRFMLPIVPIIQFLILLGLFNLLFKHSNISTHDSGVRRRVLAMGIVLLFSLPSLKVLHLRKEMKWGLKYDHYFAMAKWCSTHTPKDAVIACRKPGLFYLYANRKVSRFKNTNNAEELLTDLRKQHVSYIVIDRLGYSSTGRYLVPAVRNNIAQFKQVCHIGDPPTFLMKWDYIIK
ncbi:phospholipid carrier-dependent glycosyltransferase [Halosquirtibacter xylanolyticus]|uniref:ArnT family glycosyltransferase n=1 Tax=Halosquirtibacter xylanolyticus TaxID=3374599 RepID=UPI0037490F85|nr:phospholipid carrier-dependent glycosyltransferase [Prolixibacteraceae bacterium]